MDNPFFSQMQSSKWAMEPYFLESFVRRIAGLPYGEILGNIEVSAEPRNYTINNGIATIQVKGVLLKSVPKWMSWLRFWGIDVTGYDEIQDQLARAMNDKAVNGIHLQVESPGGIVDGLAETADAIYNARQSKKITATIEDLGASAAYWLTSQAETIETNRTSEIGSIGVYVVYLDSSKFADELGFKVIIIRSGEHKGMGVPGAEISEEQVKAVQENIDAIASQFVEAVARGRSKDRETIETLATGQLWIADKARKLGLVDKVTNNLVQNNSTKKQNKGDSTMEDKEIAAEKAELEAEKEKARNDRARLEECKRLTQLKEAFPDDLAYAVESFEKGLTVEQAKADYCDVLREKMKSSQQTNTNETDTNAGPPPLKSGDTDETGVGDFMAEAKELAAEKKISVTTAMKLLARQKPQVYKVFRDRCESEGKQMYAEAC